MNKAAQQLEFYWMWPLHRPFLPICF